MPARCPAIVVVLSVAVGLLCWCCGAKSPRPAKQGRSVTVAKKPQPAKQTNDFMEPSKPAVYCPERAKAIKEGDELYEKGEAAFNTWQTTHSSEDIKEALRLLNESFDKYREAKDKYGMDGDLNSKFQRNNKLRWLAMKHAPI
jgi:hypothetical protein